MIRDGLMNIRLTITGTIYSNQISSILEHTFGGLPRHRSHGNTFTFDPEELVPVAKWSQYFNQNSNKDY